MCVRVGYYWQNRKGAKTKSVSKRLPTCAALNKHKILLRCPPILSRLRSPSLGYLYGDAETRLMRRLLYYLPSGQRTESHVPHLSPPALLLAPTNARSSPLLSLHVSSAWSSIPPAFVFAFISTSLSLLLGELHAVSSPLCRVHLLIS